MSIPAPAPDPAGFFADPSAWRPLQAVTAPSYRTRVAAFIAELAQIGITSSHVDVDDFRIFQHARLRAAVDAFIADQPGAPLPLERITIAQYARAGRAAADLDRTRAALVEAEAGLTHLARRCNITVRLHVFAETLDAVAAEALATAVAQSAVDTLGFYYTPAADLTDAAIADLRATLARLAVAPACRSPAVLWGHFPFCFFPASAFRLCYREALAPLLGHIGAQRDLVRKVAARPGSYPTPCAACRCRAACHTYTDVAGQPGLHPFLRARRETAVLFAGGSLAPVDALPDASLVWSGPADQGSMLAAVLDGFETILLADGYFMSRFPCTTFEVMLALENGVRVLGGASIGALRALELERHGAVALGEVVERLRAQPVKPYHWVAQTYDLADRPLTAPPVQVLDFLDQAQAAGELTDVERAAALATLEQIPFLELTLPGFLKALPDADLAARLRAFRDRRPADAFEVKRRDARRLLEEYQRTAHDHDPAAARPRFQSVRSRALEQVFDLYLGEPDLQLPPDWATSADREAGAPGGRAVPADVTCERARRFFRGLDVLVADTSKYDPSGQHVLSVFFPAFYHLDYYPSSATGSGPVYADALAAAYMELVERLPAGALHIRQRSLREWGLPGYPAERLPQFYNWGTDPAVQEKVIADHGYVRVTELNTGRPVLIPKSAVMFAYSGTDGFAAGNTRAEAILYGLYEVIERDTGQLHLVDPILRAGKAAFLLDPRGLDDPRCAALLAEVADKGCRFLLYELPNTFGLPCVMCEVYDQHRGVQSHGGIAVRADLRSAAYAALREAYMQHITYFVGTRDDYRPFTSDKQARLAYANARATLFDQTGHPPTAGQGPQLHRVVDELHHVTGALARGGLTEVLVADTSPRPHFELASVKVIVPGLDLWFCPDYQPSPHLRARAAAVRRELGWPAP